MKGGLRASSVPLVLAIAAGCGATLAEVRERDLCYERAETAAQKRVDVECEGASFSECPAAPAILDDLRKAQEGCP